MSQAPNIEALRYGLKLAGQFRQRDSRRSTNVRSIDETDEPLVTSLVRLPSNGLDAELSRERQVRCEASAGSGVRSCDAGLTNLRWILSGPSPELQRRWSRAQP